jgi:hypothetical protein
MFEQTVETSATPHVTVSECMGNLVVRGSEERQIALYVQGKAGDVNLKQEGETFTLATRTDCLLACPPGTTVSVDTVRGNLRVERVDGPVTADTVHGNVKLRGAGPTALKEVFGNLSARHVAGALSAGGVRGNAQVRQVEGVLALAQVDGNLVCEDLDGGLAAEQIRGNARLGPPFPRGKSYRLTVSGNLAVRLPADASLRLSIRAGGRLRSYIPDLILEQTDGESQDILGTGEASLEACANGNITLRPLERTGGPAEGLPLEFVTDLEGLSTQIEARITEEMAQMEIRLAESLSHVDSEDVRRRIERAAQRTRRAADRAAEQARMRAERAERRWKRASGQRPRPSREPVTDEERMRVLRLVEEGKITPEQAADLLAAMEGQ